MLDAIRDLIERTKSDPDFRQRVRERAARERANDRPAARKASRKYRHRHVDRERAREAVKLAVYNGWIKPELCAMRDEHCRGRLETHHWHGYDEEHALDVQWLCRWHHKIADAAMGSYASHSASRT